jgi:predicted GNAT superfamily acetyltransferase
MVKSTSPSEILIRDLASVRDFESVQRLEKRVWEFEDVDLTPVTLAIATRAAGSIWVGAFDGEQLAGFAFAMPSLEGGKIGLHSHTLAVLPDYSSKGLGHRLKLAQRQRAISLGIKTITWTFDPLRTRNAHLNFTKLGVIADSYRPDFYGPTTSSSLHTNGTDRLWVTWRLDSTRVERRTAGHDPRAEVLDSLRHLPPLVRFNGDAKPAEADFSEALARQRIAIEIPGDIAKLERDHIALARQWRLATRRAFSQAIQAGFIVKEFCRSIRGRQGPGAYLLERGESESLNHPRWANLPNHSISG